VESQHQAKRRGAGVKAVNRYQIDRLLESQKHCCAICGGWLISDPNDPWHIDHIVPVSKGGKHVRENLQITHSMCNLKKGNKYA
jgi:5-methylcytosine-specific restriction endonuclease McrA